MGQAMCKTNYENLKKLSVPHTGGSKTLARRKDEMEIECGHRLGRGIMYKATHTKKDGTPINDEAKEIIDKIDASESEENSSQIGSSTDSLTRVLGKEHPGYVRGMGLGPCPSQVLGSTTHQMRGVSLSSTNEVALVEEVKDLREELRTSNERMHTLEAQMTQMASVLRSVAGHILADLSNIIGSQFSD